MTTDRELLELAAMAAGIQITPCTCSDTRWPFKRDEEKSGKRGHWNPLEDDGDALRLAAALEIDIEFHTNVEAIAWGRRDNGEQRHVSQEPGLSMRSTRRAIVRAAAGIGRAQAPKTTGGADIGQGAQKGTP